MNIDELLDVMDETLEEAVNLPFTGGKRIFRMTPIHHAFEMRGWREVKIDGFFALIAVIGVAMGIFYICVA